MGRGRLNHCPHQSPAPVTPGFFHARHRAAPNRAGTATEAPCGARVAPRGAVVPLVALRPASGCPEAPWRALACSAALLGRVGPARGRVGRPVA